MVYSKSASEFQTMQHIKIQNQIHTLRFTLPFAQRKNLFFYFGDCLKLVATNFILKTKARA